MSTYSEYLDTRIRGIKAMLAASSDPSYQDELLDQLSIAQGQRIAESNREAIQAQRTFREQMENPPDWPPYDPDQAA